MAAERILVIEDEPAARHALGSLLVDEGYTVCTAENGHAGLKCLREFRPDTIVCDFYLPDINGLQVLRQARATASGRQITFIVVTGGGGGEETEFMLQTEADFFFRKPVNLLEFRRVLRRPASRVPEGWARGYGVHNQQGAVHG